MTRRMILLVGRVIAALIAPISGRLTNSADQDDNPSYSPDSSKIAWIKTPFGGNVQIWMMNSDATGPILLATAAPGAGYSGKGYWFPNGQFVLWNYRAGLAIHKIATDGSGVTVLLSGSSIAGPLINAPGMIIVYRHTNTNIYTMTDTGAAISPLTTDGGSPGPLGGTIQYQAHCWAPGGFDIYYVRIAGSTSGVNGPKLWKMHFDGTNKTQIDSIPAARYLIQGALSCSPDGTKVAYISDDGSLSNFGLYVANTDGSGTTLLMANSLMNYTSPPSWSADSSKITIDAFDAVTGYQQIYVVNADGTGSVKKTSTLADNTQPDWSFDGSMIVFTSHRDGNNEIYAIAP